MEQYRTAIAVLLLSVVLPMALVLPFHHHDCSEHEEHVCELCEHHLPHPAHLSSDEHADDCLICQFLGISYLPEASAGIPTAQSDISTCCAIPSNDAPSAQVEHLSTRAPPYLFC